MHRQFYISTHIITGLARETILIFQSLLTLKRVIHCVTPKAFAMHDIPEFELDQVGE